ncbi:chromatin modification-related protein EAF1 B-like isoform X1 [Zingiber officinale]|uniref:chromatin modification-related protein EAF1 B-like isoform X1 n=1 Tax=Zingiber officinale TaxID=94328 RepID=UPI001C4D3463|nr:chromatin modification-related protein EAF1 B-like isoform X1 [Zingiber officinale]XP_042376812.1 chromatin modification-related protein EAF1 B-like isoform X1 [Zingiber officinale]XP_042376813.1 chromatin modification-related protein EAF1 B-like isoform X1 [Zingiber officinale]XP_042376814.1 chromatin modification-related protein EAF1 B-like isoform X1 [Zingiber officinale]XP_042376815.1 chromatin modification-related protein EAF1 B-like isoform X1 [Zingiber officinale]
MGGVVECGFGVDTKLSPGHAEIERAQAELQHESEIREERRRELEFLEKGGNPLDFKFGHGASASVQSTSCTDQRAEPYVTSEAKGSFTLAASPHGDSVESSEKPGGSMSRETNIGDNLLLFKRENSKVHGERYAKHRGKRGSVGLLEQSSQVGVNHNMKEVDDSIIFRPGANGQAYARRNRSKTTRDSANLSLTDAASRHGNKASVASSNAPASKDIKAQDSSFSSISNAKDDNQNCILKVSMADDRADIPLDVEQNNNTTNNIIVDEMPEEVKEVKITENMQLDDSYIQHSSIPENKDTSSQSGAFIVEDGLRPVGLLATPLESSVSKNTCDVGKINGFGAHDETKIIFDEDDTRNKNFVEGPTSKNLHSDSMDENTIANGAVNNESPDDEQPLLLRSANGRSGGDVRDQTISEQSLLDARSLKEDNEAFNSDTHINANNASCSVQLNLSDLVVREKDNDSDSKTEIVSEVTPVANSEPEKLNDEIICESATKMDISSSQPSFTKRKDTGLLLSSAAEFPKVILDNKSSLSTTCLQTSTSDQKKAHEDAILKEAQLIEARLKRAGELPTSSVHLEKHQKCHWDFVLQEMAWMANDFMQERLWKTTAASQVSRLIASCGRTMFKQENLLCKQRSSARSLARAVMDFWRTAELICSDKTPNVREFKSDSIRPSNVNESDVEKGKIPHSVMQYAARFLKHNGETSCCSTLVEAPTTPDCPNGPGILIIPREDKLIEENIFYKVPHGAMQAYRESVEVQLMHHRKLANSVHQEECEASLCNSIAGGHGEDVYEEEEGETGTYHLPGNFEGGLLSKLAHKKRKHMQQKSSATRHNEDGTYFSYEPCSEYKSGNQPFILNGKRNSSTFNVGSFPTKRVRTASRQRFVSPYSSGALGPFQMTSKTDASSEDTSSFLDDQSSLHGGSMARKNSGVDNTVDFDRQLSFDGEISSKSKKKKKKPKHLGYKNSLNIGEPGLLVLPGKQGPIRSSYEQRLQTDPSIQHEQNSKRRMESQNFDSNGNTGFGQHVAKKPKLLRQMIEASPDGLVPFAGSLPSPVASQMSNMSNSNKLIKVIASRDRARKSKALKMAAGQSGPGSPWSNFEDQALVVLVHDMGPNWELISDAMNSTLQFKCIFRKPKECKERHKFLMDKSAGDGADSAEDSGSSQPYPSTLPGIPKGSARQLFQRLQGPIEEDILKTHFEKIILHRQKLSPCSCQIGNQEPRQITQAHSSHVVALSQVCPNNLNGGILTPFDFCESISSSPDVFPLAYQGPHTGSLTVPSHQGPVSPVLPTSNANTILQGSTGLVLSSSLPLASGPSNPSSREPQRFGVPRPSTVSVDDPQRMQQYSQMLPGRNHQQPNVLPGTLPMGVDRGVRMLPVPGGMGLMSGRGIPMSRPTFQGINSPGMLNMVTSGNMVASGSHGVQNSVNVHPSVVSSQGNSTMRPRDPLQMLRPGQNPDEHRQIMMQEMQMQTSPTNGQSVSPFNGISTSFPNATTVPASAQTFPVQQHQQSHQMLQQGHMLGNPHPHIQGTSHSSPQQQAYAMRAAKERQLHQRMMPQLQRHISVPNAVPPAQTNAQVQSQSQSSSTVIPVSSSQGQHKQQNISRNPPSGISNQINQRQRQQVQQNQSRQPQQQRQSSQQQAKLMKGLGRGGMLINHNLSTDSSQVSGFSAASKNQLSDKNILQQSQGFFPASSALNSTSNQIGNQTNIYPHSLSQSTKQLSPISDTSNQGSTQNSPSNSMLTPQQAAIPSVSLVKHNQQPQHRYLNQSQPGIQRTAIQQNRHINSDDRIQSSTDQCPIVQVVTSASSVQCTDSASSVVSSSTRWNPEPLYDKDAPNPTGYVSSKQETVMVSDTLVPSSSQGLPHQLSGGMSVHGNTNGGQRQQQQQLQQLQQQQLKHQPQQQHEQLVSRHSDLGAG